MAISNTATPVYYKKFRDDVLSGKIPICKEISLEMNRIDALIADPDVYYDPDPVEGFLEFCENEMTLTDGSRVTNVLFTFKLWAEAVFGWWYFKEKKVYIPDPNGGPGFYHNELVLSRLCTKQYIIAARGVAKTMYLSWLHAYFLTVDPDTKHQVTVAPTMRQSDEVLSPIRTAIQRAPGPLFKFLTLGSPNNTTGPIDERPQLTSTKRGIEMRLTTSLLEVRPMSISKLQGLRPFLGTVDEWLSTPIREDVVGALEQGCSKLDDYLLVSTSSEGTVRNGAGDSIKIELLSILRGEYRAKNVSIFYYRLDSVEQVAHPELWVMAQPNIGLTVSYSVYAADVERAEKSIAARNDILAKRFGIPRQGYTYFFSYEETLVKRRREYGGMACSLGVDLSQGDDFCAFTFMFPLSTGGFGAKALAFITNLTLEALPPAVRENYETFIREGSLLVSNDSLLEIDWVYDEVMRYILDSDYSVRSLGYDPYYAKAFLKLWERENGPYGIEKVIQGYKTETVPLGELKTLAESGLLHFDQALMSFSMANAVAEENTNGGLKLLKMRHAEKIDNVSAMLCSLVAYKAHKDLF